MKAWETCKVLASNTIMEVLKIIDCSALQMALVVDKSNKLIGIVTDGDVRRAILKGIALDDTVNKIMNCHPIIVNEKQDRDKVLLKMQKEVLNQIPVVNDDGNVVDLILLKELVYRKRRENTVVLMVGGLGTRLRPLTNDCPKPLLKVGNKPILETIIENFIDQGFYKFYLAVNYKSDMIEKYFGDGKRFDVQIKYIHEEKRMGTAGALSLLSEKNVFPIVVMNGDLLTKVNFGHLLTYHENHNAVATMAVREYNYQIPYGVVNLEKSNIVDIQEKPSCSFFVNAGIYVLSPETIKRINEKKFFDMPELFQELIKDGKNTVAFPIHEYWIDIGKMDDLKKAQGEFMEVFE